ncbi:ribonuclease E/G [Phaeobacter gallaeciensis]|uniref:Ribonuclease E n=1 Tax=Phaeobacter gallaeciensis TaxID=60890 RepID=A0A366WTG1_9RHOB|nr:ribonuclease E/G [Phaeobacter gallaeciensis]RBW52623.1 ribonuclease E/G [Phaeobacter gallaeciensis]
MAKKMLIDATHAEETRVVVVDGNKVEEFDFESENKRQLAGNIYLAKVTRVEPSLQAAFVDYGGNRHGFLAFSEIHPDYYQIPVADREALMEEERAYADAMRARDDDDEPKPKRKSRSRSKSKSAAPKPVEAVEVTEAESKDAVSKEAEPQISGMETIDLTEGDDANIVDTLEGSSPMERVAETPVEEPLDSASETGEQPAAEVAEVAEVEEAESAVASDEASVAAEDVAPVTVDETAVADTESADASEASETDADDKPQGSGRTMAADIVSKDAVIASDDVTPDTDAKAEDQSPEAEASEAEASEAEAEEVVSDLVEEATPQDAVEASSQPEAVADDTQEPALEAAAVEQTETPENTDASSKADPVEEDAESEEAAPEETGRRSDATSKDESIESVADEDDSEDIRPPRKPRPRRYKIQEVIKVRQILLVQVVKEERGNKGAALTTYLSLAGRYCVLMPNTARGGGISRKITNVVDRKKLKEIAAEIDVPQGAGLIVRTAGAKRTKAEIKRDYEYLQRLWEQIRALTLKSIAPAKIYEEGDLIKRSIRDLYNRDIDEVIVEGERGYRIAKDFMKMIMPSHAKNVKRHDEGGLPLFARYQVESYLAGMFNPTVQLRSGGYIVIGVTEALVAIDVNSGRATKEGSIEETALKTNLEAAEEVARQLRLRDLAGLIVIDFIDMDERKNNAAVEKKIKDKLKTDRARIQIGRISGFGLMEMSRQRLRPGMIEATTQPCSACHGTGLIRSDDSMALNILRQIEEEGTRRRSREVLVRCPVNIANFLMNQKREHIAQLEARYGLSIRIEGDVHLVSPDFSIEKFKTATRTVPEAPAPVVSVDTSLMEQIDAAEPAAEAEVEDVSETPVVEEEGETKPKRKRRRRRRRKGNGNEDGADEEANGNSDANGNADSSDSSDESPDEVSVGGEVTEDAPKPKRRRRSRKKSAQVEENAEGADAPAVAEETSEDEAEKPKRKRTRAPRRKNTSVTEEPAIAESTEAPVEVVADALVSEPEQTAESVSEGGEIPASDSSIEIVAEPVIAEAVQEVEVPEFTHSEAADSQTAAEPVVEPEIAEPEAVALVEAATEETAPVAEEPAPEPEAVEPAKPKRRGWWSLGS